MNFVKTLCLALAASFYSPGSFAQVWLGADYSVSSQGETVELSFSENTAEPNVIVLDGGTPRLVLDWPKMTSAVRGEDIGQGQKAIAAEGAITRLRFAPRGKEGLRLVMEVSPQAVFAGTQNLGNRLLVNFSNVREGVIAAQVNGERLDPFTYDVPIARLKPSLTVKKTSGEGASTLQQRQAVQHDPFLYAVPIPRIKPYQKGREQQQVSGRPPVKTASLDIYSPSKRIFKSSEVPYPRTAPHIGASQRIASIGVRPATLAQRPGKPVIVIDPGHGGYDPGAIGAKGTKEKLITSTVAKRLAEALRKLGRYDIVITRTKDVYVEHDDRLRIARERSADLFISLHADSTENGKAAGASVYTLADRAKNRSKKITHTQNWIVDVDLSEQTASVGDILVDLAQRKTQSHSAEFADQLVTELEKTVPLVRNTHRRAGYYVLLAPDVPAVLLELGFISNAEDERRLNKVSEQEKIIKAVIKAINGYFNAKKP